jgi:4-amino-4-deoxy-L-arabinose transferase-like glycosyltransferase
MSRVRQRLLTLTDPLVGLVLCSGYLALLLSTASDLGYARDEGFYYQAAQSYQRWFELLAQDAGAALERRNLDRFWGVNREHPALMKSLFAWSQMVLYERWQWFDEAGTAGRFPGMVVSSLALGVTYWWGRHALGRGPALAAAVLLGLMPRVFYHAHLSCFDVPVAAIWLVTTYAYWRSLAHGGVAWPLLTGVLYGLLLNTKHNSWLLPGALVVHLMITCWAGAWPCRPNRHRVVPSALLAMVTIGPALFYATWPWIWHDTGRRLVEYVTFHTGHAYYNMEFLGQTYWKPPMPRGYAWVMTAATVPAITLVLFGIGLVDSARRRPGQRLAQWVASRVSALRRRAGRSEPQRGTEAERAEPAAAPANPAAEVGAAAVRAAHVAASAREAEAAGGHDRTERQRCCTDLLWLVCLLVSLAPWLSSNTPIFGGTKHWMTAYPFLCLFAGRGFQVARDELQALLRERPTGLWARPRVLTAALLCCVVWAPAVMTLHSHPWGLSAYTPLVGGASGAANLGLNRTFWGYTTGAVQDFLNQRVPGGGSVYVHDTAMQSFNLMRRDRRLRPDIVGSLRIHDSAFALYHHEPHMRRVEHQVWVDYGTTAPVRVGSYDGVPVIWIYQRP